jgi:hypothetical protein
MSTISYTNEQQEWDDRAADWLGAEARLISVSMHSSDIRVYRTADTVTKLRRFSPATICDRPSTLEDEYMVLSWLRETGAEGLTIPSVKSYRRDREWEMMSMVAMDAPLAHDPVASPTVESLTDFWGVVGLVWLLNRKGVSHGDLVRSNVGPSRHGDLILMDFDQAVIGSRTRCVLRDFLGFSMPGRVSHFSLIDRIWEVYGFRLIPRGLRFVYRSIRRKKPHRPNKAIGLARRCAASGNDQLMEVAEIWAKASASGANSPGGGVAYYSLDIGGIHFPGERPWILRWDMMRRVVDFRGKRLVELGCNLGLLSIHARFAGASEVVGADHNALIVEAAKRLAAIFRADGKFFCADFDNDTDWEGMLGTGDIVTALSLTYWLRDSDRLWRYLATFPEVIFEGHESADEIEARFGQAGFTQINRIGLSERNRVVYHASR